PNEMALLGGLASVYDKWGKPATVLLYRQQQAALLPEDPAPKASIAAFCWNMSYRQGTTMDPLERNRWVDTGLEAAAAALKLKPDHLDGLTYKNLLLRERAKLRIDPDQVAALQAEATKLLSEVNEMRKKQ